ncbi:DUF456 domain-containing protein, partial [Patescibacteria group bacterium]|nr:DUF456 domain-containing protein [Patescibacteria group bacterium]
MFLNILVVIIVLIVMLIGLVGEVLPVVPGMILIWLAALAYGIYDGFENLSLYTIVFLILCWLIASLADVLTTWLTTRHINVSWYGILGALVGAIIGFISFAFWGMILGIMLGAFAGEFWYKRQALTAIKASAAAIIGFALGSALKIFIAIFMILVF